MGANKKVLVITDGTDSVKQVAQSIEKTLTRHTVQVCLAENFAGTDILPVDIFFLGCENPNPSSFAYLEEMLAHINFAGRKCGIFSSNEKTLKYLKGIVKDCEAVLAEPFLIKYGEDPSAAVYKWLKEIIE